MTNKNILNPDRIVFSLCVQDIQDCAEQEYGRELTADEVIEFEKYISRGALEWYETFKIIIDLCGVEYVYDEDQGDK